MTRAEIMALAGRELDKVVAWKVFGADGLALYAQQPPYFTDANAARLVLAEVERRGKIKPFCDALWGMRNMDAALSVIDEMWACLTATPEQICRAALLAMEMDG